MTNPVVRHDLAIILNDLVNQTMAKALQDDFEANGF